MRRIALVGLFLLGGILMHGTNAEAAEGKTGRGWFTY